MPKVIVSQKADLQQLYDEGRFIKCLVIAGFDVYQAPQKQLRVLDSTDTEVGLFAGAAMACRVLLRDRIAIPGRL